MLSCLRFHYNFCKLYASCNMTFLIMNYFVTRNLDVIHYTGYFFQNINLFYRSVAVQNPFLKWFYVCIETPGSIVADPGCLSRIRFFASLIRIKQFKYFWPKLLLLSFGNMIWDVHPGSSGRVSDPHWFNADPDPAFFLISDPDPGSGSSWKFNLYFLDQNLQFTYP